MITFEDGPAKEARLSLRRAPVLLRVVRDRRRRTTARARGHAEDGVAAWDALDQLTDVARPHEDVFLYRLTTRPQYVHIRACKRAESGMRVIAMYAEFPERVPDLILRDPAMWVAWCNDNRDRVIATYYPKGDHAMFTVTINTKSAAFERSPTDELGRVLRDLANHLPGADLSHPIELKDRDGVSCGTAQLRASDAERESGVRKG